MTTQAKKGLEGVVFDTTSISKVIPEQKALYYRGYPVHELATQCTFEEVAHLLLRGELPTKHQLGNFVAIERCKRAVPDELLELIKLFPKNAHPMDTLRTMVSFLGTTSTFENLDDASIELLAKIPTMVAAQSRIAQGLDPIAPKEDLGFSENFFHMCFGSIPSKSITSAFDGSMVLYAEHGFNASTFTSRVVVSSLSDIISGVTAAIGSLKGPLHGGANEAVMHMLKEVGAVENAEPWMRDALREKKKIMGFGHRLYRLGDSRVATMSAFRDEVASETGGELWIEISKKLEEVMVSEKGIYPNLDFPAGPTYYMMGFDIELFTPIFVMSRITGWCAHIQEQLSNNRLVRPLSEYSGEDPRKVVALMSRN